VFVVSAPLFDDILEMFCESVRLMSSDSR
jgi:hypothetical protein